MAWHHENASPQKSSCAGEPSKEKSSYPPQGKSWYAIAKLVGVGGLYWCAIGRLLRTIGFGYCAILPLYYPVLRQCNTVARWFVYFNIVKIVIHIEKSFEFHIMFSGLENFSEIQNKRSQKFLKVKNLRIRDIDILSHSRNLCSKGPLVFTHPQIRICFGDSTAAITFLGDQFDYHKWNCGMLCVVYLRFCERKPKIQFVIN